MGMGFLHASSANQQTEESLIADAEPKESHDGSLVIWTDYVCGRMIKTKFKVDKDGNLEISPEAPRHDYQSWAGKYSSASELIEATNGSF